MKKFFVLSSSFVTAIIVIYSLVSNKKEISYNYNPPVDVVYCSPPDAFSTQATLFTPNPNPPAVMIRKNINSLTPGQITSLKTGITNMKALPYTNPTSWQYQAAIHGTTLSGSLPSWNTCHQPGAAFFFLAWHRMYCYYFERILRHKSGDPNLTLPYWNYNTSPSLHAEYRNSAAGNPLYDGSRNASINGGGSLPASIGTSIDLALTAIPYYDFQSDVNGPHGSVHGAVGGNMCCVSSAALDPVFWLHHCNIDRLWEVWLDKCGGRVNPADAPWLTKSYTFFDETGAAISMTGSQVVNTATQLNYKYDDDKSCLKIPWKIYIYKLWPLIRWPQPWRINKGLLKRPFKEADMKSLDNFVRQNNKSKFDFSSKDAPDKITLELMDVKVEKRPEGVVEAYLNLGPNEVPSPKSKSFIGLVDLFEVSHAASHPGMANESKIKLNASHAVKALGLSITDLKNAELSFFVRGNSVRGQEVPTEAGILIGTVNVGIETAQK